MTQGAAPASDVAGRALWQVLVMAAGAGAIAAFGLQPYGLWPLTFLGLLTLPVFLSGADTWRRAGIIGWAWATGYFAHGMSWIVEPFLVDVARHGWMAPFALIFMAGGLALFWGAASAAAFRLGNTTVQRTLVLCAALGVAELVRAYVFTGFPWAAIPQVLIDTPAAQLLAWIGPHGLGLWVLAASILPATVYLSGKWMLTAWALAPAGLLFLAALLASPPQATETGTTVRLVQPNAPQHEKWHPDHVDRFFERQVAYTGADAPPDLVVWPETAIPWMLHNADPAFEIIADAARGAPVALGVQRRDGVRFYNSLVVVDEAADIMAQYDKHHLVPFGEYMPLGWIAARFGIHGLAAEDGGGFSAGPGPLSIEIDGIGTAIPLICYEAVFPQDVRAAGRGRLLLQVTNDAWFGTRSGPFQHLAQARMRAIEQGMPLVRSANTGVSAMIDPYGRIVAHIPLGEAGFVDADLPEPAAPTLYARTGDWLAILLLLVLGCVLFANQFVARRTKTH